MTNADRQRITLAELAALILALPPERQAAPARYQVTDYSGEPLMFEIYGIVDDGVGEPAVQGNDRRTYDSPQRGPV
jgi:hypothetical protein